MTQGLSTTDISTGGRRGVVFGVVLGLLALSAASVTAGCGSPDDQQGAAERITLRSEPDPPRIGENQFHVTLRDEAGMPVTDADVSALFYMPAMPAMNMPEMREHIPLTHEGDGNYRGRGNVIMAGEWEVTVVAERGAQEIARRTLTVRATD